MLREIDSGPHTDGVSWPRTLTDSERAALKRRLDVDGEAFLTTDDASNPIVLDPTSIETPPDGPKANNRPERL